MDAEKRGLDRNVIKCIAIVAMLLNHIAQVFFTPEFPFYEVFISVGHFTAITMCYFLVEGFEYTRSKKKYGQRLLLFAVLSQVQYTLAFDVVMFNMLFSLLFSFLILCVLENVQEKTRRVSLIVLLFILSIFSDWALMAPLFTLLFWWSKKDRKKIAISYGISILVFIVMMLPNHLMNHPFGEALLYCAWESLGMVASAIVILFFYQGRKSKVAPRFFKWFFYGFYPGHILVLYLLRLVMK